MKVQQLKNLTKNEYLRIVNRSAGTYESILPYVRSIMRDVRKNGDSVILRKYQKRYGANTYTTILVTEEEIKEAYKNTSKDVVKGLLQMKKNITAVHKAQLPRKKDTVVNSEKGISVWRE